VSSLAIALIVAPLALASAVFLAFLIYVLVKYTPVIRRIFEEKPVFLPLRVAPAAGGEEVRFPAEDGLELAGSYFRARTPDRAGVLVFCHEFLGDRWSFHPYVDHLRDLRFDLFTFDFRNHGDSAADPAYQPLQWVSDREVRDLRGALSYLRSRPDRDAAGVGLFGVSRGGGTALYVAADDPGVWAVATDGAFPTRGTMLAYMLKWAEIYVGTGTFYHCLPLWMFRLVAWVGRLGSERRLGCRFPSLERAVPRLAPRPWLMIHGEKDAYIRVGIARQFFAEAGEPKELWIVPEARHNRCREVEPEAYAERLSDFCRRYGPRRLPRGVEAANPTPDSALATTSSATGLAARLSG
jgi:alpha-beta hydrolase superfamily lysophospholipase